jgi:hypothetical protein
VEVSPGRLGSIARFGILRFSAQGRVFVNPWRTISPINKCSSQPSCLHINQFASSPAVFAFHFPSQPERAESAGPHPSHPYYKPQTRCRNPRPL